MHVLIDSTMLQLWPAVRQGLPSIAFITDIHQTGDPTLPAAPPGPEAAKHPGGVCGGFAPFLLTRPDADVETSIRSSVAALLSTAQEPSPRYCDRIAVGHFCSTRPDDARSRNAASVPLVEFSPPTGALSTIRSRRYCVLCTCTGAGNRSPYRMSGFPSTPRCSTGLQRLPSTKSSC
jgi:hypothetical protein